MDSRLLCLILIGVAAFISEIVIFVTVRRPHATLKKPVIIIVISLVIAISLAFTVRFLGKRWEIGTPAKVIESVIWWAGIVMYWLGKGTQK